MILTNTLNPSIDISYQIDALSIGEVHRPSQIIRNAGGKGINVTKVLEELGSDVTATGYLGGGNGEWIKTQLTKRNINQKFITIENETRQCISINDGKHQTEILESGPEINEDEQSQYIKQLQDIAHQYTVVTISGSTPHIRNNTKTAHLQSVLELLSNSYNILDVNASELKPILQNDSFVHAIKPNQSEFEDLIEQQNLSQQDIVDALKQHTLFKNIDVFVTLGSEGAIVKWNDEIYQATIPKVEVKNPVGSGDSTVAGLAYSVDRNLDPIETIQTALACGTSNATQIETGHIDLDQVKEYIKKVGVVKLT